MTQHEDTRLEQLFERWLMAETLDESELLELKMHPVWSERMLAHQALSELSIGADESLATPQWNRDAAFEQYLAKPSWWRQQGISAAALCFSLFACAIMLFDIKVMNSDQGAQLTWSAQQQQQINQQFVELARINNQVIEEKLTSFEQEQKETTAELVSYILENSRDERKEDIADVVQMWQNQRNDDMQFLRQQFNDINYNIRLASQRSKEAYSRQSDDSDSSVAEE